MIYPDYELGLNKLRNRLEQVGGDEFKQFLILDARLRENLRDDLRYGSTSDLQSRRAMIIEQLNSLVLENFDRLTFNDLCYSQPQSQINDHIQIKEPSRFPKMQNGDIYISRFAIKGFIGRGGFSDVYLAWDRIHDREVVVKLFSIDRQPDFLRQYVDREIKMAQVLASKIPGLVSTHEVIKFSQGVCLVQEHIPGESLHNRISAKGVIEAKEAILTTMKLCDTLNELHKRGIAHCDVKPLNIIIRSSKEPILIDLGTSRYFSEKLQVQQIVVSVPYSSKELTTGLPIDCRVDIYSLGITLLHMLAGLPEWGRGKNIDFDTAALPVASINAPSDKEIRNHILRCLWQVETDDLRAIIQKAIEEQPHNRYLDAVAFRNNLAEYLNRVRP